MVTLQPAAEHDVAENDADAEPQGFEQEPRAENAGAQAVWVAVSSIAHTGAMLPTVGNTARWKPMGGPLDPSAEPEGAPEDVDGGMEFEPVGGAKDGANDMLGEIELKVGGRLAPPVGELEEVGADAGANVGEFEKTGATADRKKQRQTRKKKPSASGP